MESENLGLIISRLKESDREIQNIALHTLHDDIRANTGTISAKQQELFDIVGNLKDCLHYLEGNEKKHLCDLISVLSVGVDAGSASNVLKYRSMGNVTDFECWGHQYVKHLIIAINRVIYKEDEFIPFEVLIEPIVIFLFKHNSEIEAIDFLLEIGDLPQLRPIDNESNNSDCKTRTQISLILKFVDDDNYDRISVYLDEMSRFFNLENIILEVNKNKPTKHVVNLIKFNKSDLAIEFVKGISDRKLKDQCLYILARCNIFYKGESEDMKILSNSHISKFYSQTIENLEILKCKKLDYVLKGLNKDKIDTAAICNGLIHFGYSRDPLFLRHKEDYNIKPEYSTLLMGSELNSSVYASAGLINAFNPSKVYEMFTEAIFEKKDLGAIFALAVASYKTYDVDCAIITMLEPYLSSHNPEDITIALVAIGIVYSGNYNCDNDIVHEKIFTLLTHENPEVVSLTIYVLGSVYYGSGNMEILGMCVDIYSELNLDGCPFMLLAVLGISLFFYKRQDLENDQIIARLDPYTQILVCGMMNIGSGCPQASEIILSEALSGESDPLLECVGLVALTLVGMGDPVATEMIERIITSSQLLNSPHILKTIPLCMGLLYPSTAKLEVIDYLEKCLNSRNCNVNSVIGLGILGAGTNSSRILGILNSNFNALYKDTKASNSLIFAQGLLNMGKGMISISPLAYNKQAIIPKCVIGLLSTVILFIDESSNIFKHYSHLLFSIIQSATPKYCIGFEGEVKVGKPVETVGLTGKPNTISGTVIHTLPIVLNSSEKAEVSDLVYSEYIEDILVKK